MIAAAKATAASIAAWMVANEPAKAVFAAPAGNSLTRAKAEVTSACSPDVSATATAAVASSKSITA